MRNNRRLKYLIGSYESMFASLGIRNETKAHKVYLGYIDDTVSALQRIADKGEFEECLRAIQYSLEFDTEFFARSPSAMEKIEANKENFAHAVIHYRMLREEPERYREFSRGFIKRDRRNGLPLDGMQKTLDSYLRHLQARHSSMLSGEEAGFIAALIVLTVKAMESYAGMQAEVLEPMPSKEQA